MSCHPTATQLVYSTNEEEERRETVSSVDISELIILKIAIEAIVNISEITHNEAETLQSGKNDLTKIHLVNDTIVYCREPFEVVEAKMHQALVGDMGALLN